MSIGVLWVAVAATLFAAGSIAQAAALAGPRRAGRASWRAGLAHPLFVAGTAAELLGALAHAAALSSVPMAVAQASVTASLALTALGARLAFGTRLGRAGTGAVLAVGAALAALAAVSGTTGTVADTTTWTVVLAAVTLVLGLAATAVATAVRPAHRGTALAVVSGLGFAVCSVAARLLGDGTVGAMLRDPALLVLAAAGGLAALCWTLALRHGEVTTVTAVVVVAEVVPPSMLGPQLGDHVGGAFGVVAPLALLVAAAAGAVLARRDATTRAAPAAPAAEPAPAPVAA